MSVEVAARPQTAANPAAANPPPAVEARLVFMERTAEKPYAYTYKPPEGVAATNIRHRAELVRIENARGSRPASTSKASRPSPTRAPCATSGTRRRRWRSAIRRRRSW